MIPIHPRTSILLAVLVLAGGEASLAQRRTPVPSTEAERKLIDEGNVLRENQQFEAAVAKYQRVLKGNPDNVEALFELTGIYYDMAEHKKSLEMARRGVEYESDDLAYFYIMIGTNLDVLKQPAKAAAAYLEGLKIEPDNYLLNYNLGVTYLGLTRIDDAMASFKRALLINPEHASSHIGLAQIYFSRGYRIPALMAFARALVLEPGSGRAETAAGLLEQILKGSEDKGEAVRASQGRNDGEGDFAAAELALSASARSDRAIGVKEIVERFTTLFTALGSSAPAGASAFAAEYYSPYFIEMARKGYVEPFAYHVLQATPRSEVGDWLRDNEPRLMEFLEWSRNTRWKRIR